MSELAERWDHERVFHDALADTFDPSAMPPIPPVASDAALLAAARVAPGARVLDLGCGQGDLTLTLLARGASVTALDLSPGMVGVAARRIQIFGQGRRANLVAAPVERTGLPSESFEVILGRWILHHVDLGLASTEIARLLAPGGLAVFYENSGGNRMLTFARNHVAGRFGVARFGTPDERPMTADDWRELRSCFSAVHAEYPITDIFELLDRQVFRYRWQVATAICRKLDNMIARTPWKRYSYRVLVIARK